MKKSIWIVFLLTTLISRGQYDYSDLCIEAHTEISALRFDHAQQLIASEKSAHPENLVPTMLQAYMDFLTIIVGENEADFDSLADLRHIKLNILKEGDTQSPWYRYSIARLYLQWAFSRVKYGSYFYAARDIQKAYMLLNENNEAYPDFLPDKVSLGIMHALIGTIPDNYRWIANIFSMEGSVEQGRAELMAVLKNAEEEGYPFLKDEALFFLTFIDLNLQADRNKAKELLAYYHDADSNLMLIFSYSRILMQTGNNDRAVDILVNHPRSNDFYPFYYLEYLSGLTKLNRLDEDAGQYFLRFTANFKGASYIKSAYQRLAWTRLLKDDVQGYWNYMDRVKQYGDAFTDGDKLALRDAESGELPNLCLLKARLLYDGGYFAQADSTLNRLDCGLTTERDKTEFPYRRGRISHALNDIDAALSWYEKTIETGGRQPYYFASNAALQIGAIYESLGDYSLAEDYYRQCLQMPGKEYKTSLNQKAKAGLNSLKDKNTTK